MKYIYNISVLLIIFLSGCKIPGQVAIDNKPLSMPNTFLANADTKKIDLVNWKTFFTDPLLQKLIDTALLNNNDLKIAYQNIEIARSGLQFTKGAMLPQVSAGPSAAIRRYGLYTMDGAGNISTQILPDKIVPVNLPDFYLGLQSNWEVDFRGKLKNQYKASYARYLQSMEGIKYVKSNLIADIVIAYFELLSLDNELDMIKATKIKQTEALEFIIAQKEAGKGNELAVQQFTAEQINLDILENEITQQMLLQENKINFLLGRFPQTIARNKKTLFDKLPDLFTGVPSQLLQNRPDIKMAELNLLAAKFDLNAARAAFYPSFTINSGLGFQAFNAKYLFRTPESIAYTLLGNVVAPIVNRSAIMSNFNYAKANQLEILYKYQQSILNAYVEVLNNLNEIEYVEKIKKLTFDKNLQYQQSIQTSLDLYKSARASYLDVLLSQQNALQSNIDLINATKRSMILKVKLYKSLGGGW
jgi:NodT family efflux transporter outer membrane factor (OMF) lipoprotein